MRHSTVYGSFAVEPMPGQPQVGLCHSFFVPIKMRGRGFANKLKSQQLHALIESNYDYALCTVAGENLAQQHVLRKAGWKMFDTFGNSRLGGVTQIWGRQVEEAKP